MEKQRLLELAGIVTENDSRHRESVTANYNEAISALAAEIISQVIEHYPNSMTRQDVYKEIEVLTKVAQTDLVGAIRRRLEMQDW